MHQTNFSHFILNLCLIINVYDFIFTSISPITTKLDSIVDERAM